MGVILKGPAILIYAMAAIWSFVICMGIVHDHFGLYLSAIALVFAPIIFYLVPFYAAIVQGDWFPLILAYGITIAAALLYILGEWIDGRTAPVTTS